MSQETPSLKMPTMATLKVHLKLHFESCFCSTLQALSQWVEKSMPTINIISRQPLWCWWSPCCGGALTAHSVHQMVIFCFIYLFDDLFWPTSSAIMFIIFPNSPILFALFPVRPVRRPSDHPDTHNNGRSAWPSSSSSSFRPWPKEIY